MPLVLADRVRQSTTTAGRGPLALGPVTPQFQGFVAGIGDGNATYYEIRSGDGASWETGQGTVSAGPPATLSRDVTLSSSNAGQPVELTGTSDVFGVAPAALLSRLLEGGMSAPVALAFVMPGKPVSGSMFNLVLPFALTLPALFAGATCYVGTPPAYPDGANAVVSRIADGASTGLGALLFSPGANTAFTVAGMDDAVAFAAGDVLQLQVYVDAQCADLGITLLAARV